LRSLIARALATLASNKAFGEWGEVFAGDAVMASAALDRLLHRATVINIRGESYRLKEKRQADGSTLPVFAETKVSLKNGRANPAHKDTQEVAALSV